jgi:hypothetical protein
MALLLAALGCSQQRTSDPLVGPAPQDAAADLVLIDGTGYVWFDASRTTRDIRAGVLRASPNNDGTPQLRLRSLTTTGIASALLVAIPRDTPVLDSKGKTVAVGAIPGMDGNSSPAPALVTVSSAPNQLRATRVRLYAAGDPSVVATTVASGLHRGGTGTGDRPWVWFNGQHGGAVGYFAYYERGDDGVSRGQMEIRGFEAGVPVTHYVTVTFDDKTKLAYARDAKAPDKMVPDGFASVRFTRTDKGLHADSVELLAPADARWFEPLD